MNTRFLSADRLRVVRILCVVAGVLALCSTAMAQIEPAAPGSIEFELTSNGQSWIETSDDITIGTYVEDLLTDRNDQPDGRGIIGIVTSTGFDVDYNEDAAVVDFGRGYSSGIVFSELTAVQIVPEPAAPLVLGAGMLLWAGARRRRPANATA